MISTYIWWYDNRITRYSFIVSNTAIVTVAVFYTTNITNGLVGIWEYKPKKW